MKRFDFKNMLSAAWNGIMLSCTVFMISSFFATLFSDAENFASTSGMLRLCITTFAIGIGFGLPSFIYETELPMAVKVLFHMGIGCAVMVACSFFNGWVKSERGIWFGIAIIALQIAIAFLIWFIQYRKAKKLAEMMNGKLKNE